MLVHIDDWSGVYKISILNVGLNSYISTITTATIIKILFVFMLYIPVNNFSVMLGLFPYFPGWTSTKQ